MEDREGSGKREVERKEREEREGRKEGRLCGRAEVVFSGGQWPELLTHSPHFTVAAVYGL